VKAVVLVGGFGTRLRPLTWTTPKQMLPIVDRPMIERVVGALGRYGVTDAVLSLGYRPDAFMDAYPDGQCAGVALHYAVEPEPLDTAGAVLVVNGDVLTDLDVSELWAFHRDRGAEGTIALTPVDDPSRFGVVPIDEKGRVTAFVEKPAPGTAPTNWINAGTYVLEPSVLERIPTGRKVSIERETFPGMVTDDTLYALHSDAYWVDAGTPNTYVEVQLDLIDGVRGIAEPAVHPGADIHPTAVVDHSVVMAGVKIGEHAIIRDSVILPGARLDPRVLVDGSVIGAGARIGEGAVLSGMTVIGDRYEVRAAAHLDGARLPEEG
jgi:mannose-1-phosphate guanylyltransferase